MSHDRNHPKLTVENQATAIIEKQFVRTEGTVEEDRQWYY